MDDHPEPLDELRRLVELQRAYARVDAGDQLAAAGDVAGALREYAAAHRAAARQPRARLLARRRAGGEGSEEQAIPFLRQAFEAHPGWAELLERLPAAGLFPDDGALIARLIGTRAESEPESARLRPE